MAAFDFRSQQQRARRLTVLLVALFTVMVTAIGVTIGALAAVFLGDQPDRASLDYGAWGLFSLLVMAVIFGAAFFKLVSVGSDGARVARALGAEEVSADTRNPYKRRYLNVVEEMAIAAGLPRPRAFVIRHEKGINAFAAGGSPERAAIGVTHGALAMLTRAELAGVVAHEMAHIANHDTRLNTRLMAMVFGLVALYTVGRVILRGAVIGRPRSRNKQGGGAILAIGAGLVVLGSAGILFGRILQSAVSRRREYLADATGVQFTRNPPGLANALKKIAASHAGSRLANAHAEEARHMFFAGATGSLAGLFSTHPPLFERIRAIDPQFDPATDPVLAMDDPSILRSTRRDLHEDPSAGSSPGSGRVPDTGGVSLAPK